MECFNCNILGYGKFCVNCGCKLPDTILECTISKYFRKGFTYKEMIDLLHKQHNVKICMRTLVKKLKCYGLNRRKPAISTVAQAIRVLRKRIESGDKSMGYRRLWHHLRHDFGLTVPRDVVMKMLRELDPEGVALRKSRKLNRRIYSSGGPNYLWHCDGYDKLKPFGFPIHGCIDGFSRKILWLRLVKSNNNPAIVASIYLDTVEELGVFPRCMRTDCGTENGLIAGAQSFFHRDSQNATPHLYGSSHHNQRIEALWSQFRRATSGYHINFFKHLVEIGEYNCGDSLHVSCAHYCFTEILQNTLDSFREQWNSHFIRKSVSSEVHGRPDYLYLFPPERFSEYGTAASNRDILAVKEHLNENNDIEEDNFEAFYDYFDYLRQLLHLPECSDFDTARSNFLQLLRAADF